MSQMTSEPPPAPLIRGVSAANLTVVDATSNPTSVWTVVGGGPKPVTVLSPPNIADVCVAVDGIPTYRGQGVMMASIRQNVRGTSYGTVEVSYVGNFNLNEENDILQIATSRAAIGSEFNVNPAAAFFPFADAWIGGHVSGDGTLLERYGVSAGNVAQVAADGPYRVTIDGMDSRTDGLLFAVGGENGHNSLSTAPLADGSGWHVAVRNNTATAFDDLESTRWSFVYIDRDAPGLVSGRIAASGTLLCEAGEPSVSHSEAGVYRITIPGHGPDDGVLLLAVAEMETDGGATMPADNIISYEAVGDVFVVNVRDRAGSSSLLEDAGFAFAFVPFDGALAPAVPGDANYDGRVDEDDAAILAGHWGATDANWAMGDFNVDGLVGPADASILAANWGHGSGETRTAVPEPVAMLLGAIVLVQVVASRHRSLVR